MAKDWDRTIKVKDLLNDDESDERATLVGRAISRRLEKLYPVGDVARDDLMDGMIVEFHLTYDCESLNQTLDQLYDWGDVNKRLWIG